MIDIETLGVGPNAVILSIGALALRDFNTSFYMEINPKQPDRAIDSDTLNWWLSMERTGTRIPNHGVATLQYALTQLQFWFRDNFVNPIVWCKGTNFDVVILNNAFEQGSLKTPWAYNNVRDCRTLFKSFPIPNEAIEPNFSKHHALADCKHQARQLLAIAAAYNITLR